MDKLAVGKIVKPQGIKGELKLLSLADSPEVFNVIKKVFIDGDEYKILSVRIADGVYLALKGIADRNMAETFRNKFVYADREDIPVEENRYFVSDIIGCTVCFEDKMVLGRIDDVSSRGSTDFFTVKTTDGKSVIFPHLKAVVVAVDISEKVVIIKKERFNEVALYED